MSKLLKNLEAKKIIQPPQFLVQNTMYLAYTGSVAYGTNNDTSDLDVYGFCIPPKDVIFPHISGIIPGFDKNVPKFYQWMQHHVQAGEQEYDFTVYSIVRFFRLCADNNPNILDCLFVPRECILHSTRMSELVRENRTLFLHKGLWPKFKGYAYSQLHKMTGKNAEGKRRGLIDQFGYDVKSAMHTVRLLLEAEQLLTLKDMDLRRDREMLKDIRKGKWTTQEVIEWAGEKEKALEKIYEECDLPWGPQEEKIKALLLECIGIHYNDLGTIIPQEDTLRVDIVDVLRKHGVL